jgi:Glycosyltransferase 61
MGPYRAEVIVKGTKFVRRAPLNLAPEDIRHFDLNNSYESPDLRLYFFKEIFMLPDSTLFSGIFPLKISFPFFKGRIQHHSIKGLFDIRRKWQKVVLFSEETSYAVIHDQWTLNYYHWLTQALPRLLLIKKSGRRFKLLLPTTHNKDFHINSLKLLDASHWATFEVGKSYYELHNLIYPNHDLQIGDYHDDLIRELSLTFRKNTVPVDKKKYLFVQRGKTSSRRIVNDAEVLKTFSNWGFDVIDFEKMKFEDQVNTAAQASILAGVHGAGLSNMMFMETGSKVFELTSMLNGEQYYYFTLSNSLGHSYYYQHCQPDAADKSIQEANLFVDISLLNKNLKLMIAGTND